MLFNLTGVGSSQICDVIVAVGASVATEPNGYTYDGTITPSISSVEPRRGGTGGGTSVTITGEGFG